MDRDGAIIWDGITKIGTLNEEAEKLRQDLGLFARNHDWDSMLRLLSEHPELVNTIPLGSRSLSAPLHRAASGGAPVETVSMLLRLGAFRTLRDSRNYRAVDLARIQSHGHLLQFLEPMYQLQVPEDVLLRIQAQFHCLIHQRAHELVERHNLRLPELEAMLEFGQRRFWFAIPEMYGGFAYWLTSSGTDAKLITESWNRIAGGSGHRHEITVSECRLVDEGFV